VAEEGMMDSSSVTPPKEEDLPMLEGEDDKGGRN
jgi:hypothetical protein